MERLTLATLTLVCAFGVTAAARQAQPPRSTPAPAAAAQGTGVIAGMLSTADKGTPVRRAVVRLNRVTPGVTKTTSSDAEGRFIFTDLPAGEYRLTATKPGFLDMNYGARQPGSTIPGTPILLADGQKLEKIGLALPRGGVISGTILDEFGDPAFNTPVRALRIGYRNGEKVVTTAGNATTDDRGAYRMAGLLPGQYLVNATPRESVASISANANASRQAAAQMEAQVRAAPNAPGAQNLRDQIARMTAAPATPPPPTTGYVPVYYPGVAMPSSGGTVTLGISEERWGVDFSLQSIDTATVAGVVTISEGALPLDTRLQLIDPAMPIASVGVWFRNAEPGGRYSFQGVVPGNYVLRAYAALAPAEGGTVFTAASNVTIAGPGLTDVALTLRPGVPVAGRLSLEGVPETVDRSRIRLQLRQIQSAADWESPPPIVTMDAEGAFTVVNAAPGRYRFAITGVPDGWTIASAVFGGQDTADHHLTIEPDGKYIDGVIKLTNRTGQVSGALTTVTGDPAATHTVILFPADRTMWLPESRRIHVVQPGKDGRYQIKGLPPGDYRLVALPGPEPGRETDPAWLTELLGLSDLITISEGGSATKNITV
jgi:hypothetical protein